MDYILIDRRSEIIENSNHNRVVSIDVFRGISIALMILINTQAYFPDIYRIFLEIYKVFSIHYCINKLCIIVIVNHLLDICNDV
jgi:fatty-acid desaturase